MPELLTVEKFQEMFGEIDTPNPAAQLKRPVGAACRRVKDWVGETIYNAAVAADDADPVKSDLELAAGYLAMHFLIANFNTVVRTGGIVKAEKAEGDTVISYLTPDETSKRAQEFFDLADEICRPHKLGSAIATVEVVTNE